MNGEKNYLKILFLSVGGTKACFNKMLHAVSVQIFSTFSSLTEHRECGQFLIASLQYGGPLKKIITAHYPGGLSPPREDYHPPLPWGHQERIITFHYPGG